MDDKDKEYQLDLLWFNAMKAYRIVKIIRDQDLSDSEAAAYYGAVRFVFDDIAKCLEAVGDDPYFSGKLRSAAHDVYCLLGYAQGGSSDRIQNATNNILGLSSILGPTRSIL